MGAVLCALSKRPTGKAAERGMRRATIGTISVFLTLAVVGVAACGGSSGKTPAASGNTGNARGSSRPAATPGKAAPDSLIVAHLASASALRRAGFAATGVEDDGGAQSGTIFSSQAQTADADSLLVLDLTTYASAAEATTGYRQSTMSQPSTTTLPNTGDRAVLAGTDAYVVVGSQVLSITGRLSQAAQDELNHLKATGKLDFSKPFPATQALAGTVRKVAAALAKTMSRDATTAGATYTYTPADAVDPCATSPASLSRNGIDVTSQHVASDAPPASECVYTFTATHGAEPSVPQLAVYTLTGLQATHAVPVTTVPAFFSKIRTSFVGGPSAYSSGSFGDPVQTEARNLATDPDFAVNFDDVFLEEVTQANGSSKPDATTCKAVPPLMEKPLEQMKPTLVPQPKPQPQSDPVWKRFEDDYNSARNDWMEFSDKYNQTATDLAVEVCDALRNKLGLPIPPTH